MEGVLRLYQQPEDQSTVRLCMDERPCQLVSETIMPLAVKPDKPRRVDNEYSREGTCVVLLAYDIDKGLRYTEVKQQRTKQDYAQFIDQIISEHYRDADKVKLVQDNLNTHTKGSFYEHLPVHRAGELSALIDFVYTPKHGSWLNMAEIEFSALARQCLDTRIATIAQMKQTVQAWTDNRNSNTVKIHWSFTVDTAREKLASQYLKVNNKN
jgi:DDE superfamily endonuclease